MATRCVICDVSIDPNYNTAKREWERHCSVCKEVEQANCNFYADIFEEEDEDGVRRTAPPMSRLR